MSWTVRNSAAALSLSLSLGCGVPALVADARVGLISSAYAQDTSPEVQDASSGATPPVETRSAAARDILGSDARVDLPVFRPPPLDYARVCKPDEVVVDLGEGWIKWDGKRTERSSADLLSIAQEHLEGSDRVFRNPGVSLKIIDFLERERDDFPDNRVKLLKAKATLASSTSLEQDRTAIALLEEVFSTGSMDAALALGLYYGARGPLELRDYDKAEQFLRIVAAFGNPRAQVELVEAMTKSNRLSSEERRQLLVNALVGMVSAIEQGSCYYARTLGLFYLQGKFTEPKPEAGIEWLRLAVQIDGVDAAELFGRKFLNGRDFAYDMEAAMEFFEMAVAEGRTKALFEIGKAHAAGSVARPDYAKASEYLRRASQAGIKEADEWLAKLYEGRYGAEPQPALAAVYFRKAIDSAVDKRDLLLSLARLLDAHPDVDPDTKAVAIYREAASLGSDKAARYLGDLFLKDADDNDDMRDAERYYRLAAINGDATAARRMSYLHACGLGVPISDEVSRSWLSKAAYLGSAESMYETASTMLAADDADERQRGFWLLRNAAQKGSRNAVADLYARYKYGLDGQNVDEEQAARVMRVAVLPEGERDEMMIAIALRRLAETTDTDERVSILDELAGQIGPEDGQFLYIKASALRSWGDADEGELRELFRRSAEAGNSRGMREYARSILRDVNGDEAEAERWLNKAADSGDIKSRILNVAGSPDGTIAALDEIAASGAVCSADTMIALSQAYQALEEPESEERSRFWLDRAATLVNDDDAVLFDIGEAFYAGAAGERNRDRAKQYYERALRRGRMNAVHRLAEGHFDGVWTEPDPQEGKRLLLTLVDRGDEEAIDILAKRIAAGQTKATYEDLARLERQDTRGQLMPYYNRLARSSMKGMFGEENSQATFRWLMAAADRAGDVNAMRRVAGAYLYGRHGMDRDVEEGVSWLKRAAEGGDARSARDLAGAYAVGLGMAADAQEAQRWRERASQMQEKQQSRLKP